MEHLTEEELIDRYYREDSSGSYAARHLENCAHCAAAYEDLRRDLVEMKPTFPPIRDTRYGESVWQAIRNSVPAYEKKRKRWLHPGAFRGIGYATGCLLLILAAFVAGRHWEHSHSQVALESNRPQASQRVVLLVLGDHLDRSERFLIELKHAGSAGEANASPIQTEARELLAQNRLYRQSAKPVGDPTLSGTLDHLERVLAEVANNPDGLTQEDIARLQREMNSEGLLFDIRVLRTRVMDQQKSAAAQSKGVHI